MEKRAQEANNGEKCGSCLTPCILTVKNMNVLLYQGRFSLISRLFKESVHPGADQSYVQTHHMHTNSHETTNKRVGECNIFLIKLFLTKCCPENVYLLK